MKANVFLVVFLMVVLSSQSQVINKAFIDTTKEWSSECLQPNKKAGVSRSASKYMQEFDGDSILINNKFYHRLIEKSNYNKYSDTYDTTYYGEMYREDSSKVYVLYDSVITDTLSDNVIIKDTVYLERVLYDFSLSVGDTFIKPLLVGGRYFHRYELPEFYIQEDNLIRVVTGVDVDIIGFDTLRKITLSIPNRQEFDEYEEVWIEGIGAVYGAEPFSVGCVANMVNFYLVCCKQDNNPIYGKCYDNSLLNPNIEKFISVYPNPTKDNLNITSSEQIEAIEIINLAGQTVYSSKKKWQNHPHQHKRL